MSIKKGYGIPYLPCVLVQYIEGIVGYFFGHVVLGSESGISVKGCGIVAAYTFGFVACLNCFINIVLDLLYLRKPCCDDLGIFFGFRVIYGLGICFFIFITASVVFIGRSLYSGSLTAVSS